MLGKTLIKMTPPSLSKFDIEDGVKLVAIVAMSDFTKDYLQSVSWSLAEFRHNKIVQSPHENYFNVCRQHKEK